MAKMFYTLDETKAALGQSEDQIKQLTRDGRLREFRDGPRLMFKADQVDALKSQIGGGGLDIADSSGAPIGLADTGGGSSGGLNLADSVSSGLAGVAGSGLGSGLGSGVGSGAAGSGMMHLKDEDTALAADLGLSGTLGGIPSPGRTGGGSMGGSVGGGSLGGSMGGSGSVGSRHGINVFGDDTHLPADPMAQTAMPGVGSGGSGSDLNLEGIGSGSGLLDLTRESDETSLGAELIDEVNTPGRSRPMGPPDTGSSMAGVTLEAPRGGIVRGGMGPVYVEKKDGWSTAFGAMALGTAIFMLVAMFGLIVGVLNVHPAPDMLNSISTQTFPTICVIGLVVAVLFLAFGKLIDMSFSGKR
jgi:hypothetical protein